MNDQAAYWARRMTEGDGALTDAERAQFDAWLFADAKNEREFRESIGFLSMVCDLPAESRHALVSSSTEARAEQDRFAQRRNMLKWSFAASGVLALLAGGFLVRNSGVLAETHTTRTGEMRTVTFSEGSVAHLNTRTELRWVGNADERKVKLVTGEALFDVVHDESRPFSVVLDNSEIRVLGTRFNVYRKSTGDVVVTVLEGVVEVRGLGNGDDGSPAWTRLVNASEQIEYRSIGLVGEPQPARDPLLAVKWRSGVLQLPTEGVPLPEVLDELTRYTDKRILIRNPRLAELEIGGTFTTRDVRAALEKLTTVAPIEVHESAGAYALEYRAPASERN